MSSPKVVSQTWGIATVDGSGRYEWVLGEGPGGCYRWTKRQANMIALRTNRGRLSGQFRPVPIPDLTDLNDDLEEKADYSAFPEEMKLLFTQAHEMLLAAPQLDWHELPHVR